MPSAFKSARAVRTPPGIVAPSGNSDDRTRPASVTTVTALPEVGLLTSVAPELSGGSGTVGGTPGIVGGTPGTVGGTPGIVGGTRTTGGRPGTPGGEVGPPPPVPTAVTPNVTATKSESRLPSDTLNSSVSEPEKPVSGVYVKALLVV